MKILFDQNTPRKLRRHLRSHVVMTAAQMGWEEIANGSLILAAERAGFEVMVTGDQSIFYQQNNLKRRIALVVLSTTHWPDVNASGSLIREAVERASAGSYTWIDIEKAPH